MMSSSASFQSKTSYSPVLKNPTDFSGIQSILKDEVGLLEYTCKGIPASKIHSPGPDFIERVHTNCSDRTPTVLRSLQWMFNTGNLRGTGYLSILPVDQGIEHSAGASFAPNPEYFDPENIVKLAIEGGCNAVASTYGVLGSVARKYAHKIPFILKLNHNELLSYPNTFDETLFADVEAAADMGCAGVGATIYFGSPESRRQIQEIQHAFRKAHEKGMFTILWCYLRNNAFKKDGVDYHLSADLSGQANHLGCTIEADIIKQKLPENNGGFKALNMNGSSYGKTDERIYTELSPGNHPIELVRYQLANCYMGRAGLISSGGAIGKNDVFEAIKTAVINKRGGGMGLISGRKAFQRPMAEGVQILNAIQSVYLAKEVTIA